ncbi:MAG: family 10 glycosylhydrolase [Coleofasciculus sp. S288]|nr:family 10 glycosylhydrolase [Coleofasciculus sp. S288]
MKEQFVVRSHSRANRQRCLSTNFGFWILDFGLKERFGSCLDSEGRNKSKILATLRPPTANVNLKSPSPVPSVSGSIQNRQSKIQNRLTSSSPCQSRLQVWKMVVGAAIATSISSSVLLPAASAQTARLAVVRSLDNEGHWSGIRTRLQSSGVDYCVVDFAQVNRASDLGNTQLLFLPNVELVKPAQAAALQDWMRQGGRVIVSGPTGTLSQTDVRNRLRSLLGAYWGFAMTKPATLEPLSTLDPTWTQQAGLGGTVRGGVVIPTGLNSTTAAVWSQDENPPAIVTTQQTTFFGWRWGVDASAPVEVDSAWLRAALSRYDITPTPGTPTADKPEQSCVPSQASGEGLRSPLGGIAPTDPGDVVSPSPLPFNTRGPLTVAQVALMGQELENLIGRFESALLAANATSGRVGGAREEEKQGEQFISVSTTASASRALATAKKGLQNFREAAEQRDYNRAREQWLQARRMLWDNYPTNSKLAQPEIRAIWLDRGTIVRARSEQDLAKIFDQLAAAGFNTVFFETVNASYPIYPSRVAPEQNPLVRGWDPLAAAVKLAHERGMELHAWVWMFAAANRRHNAVLNQPTDYPGPVLSAHPDWAMRDKQGRLFDPNTKKAFFDPANPEVRSYLLALLDEIATRYQVDGIQLDYIRYPFQDPSANQINGYSRTAREQFKELTGVDPIQISPRNQTLWQQWTDFRIRQIDSFVATASQRLRTQRPNLILSAAVFALPRPERLQRLQQNWEDWAMRGELDLMVPMTYALDANGLQSLAQPLLTQESLNSALILPGIRLLNLPDMVAVDQIQLLRDLPSGGFALFAVENLNANLRSIFNRTQGRGLGATGEPIPYRQPFPAAVARYEALQQEWSFMLTNHQILILEPALSEWRKQGDAVLSALNQLAAEPSVQNLAAAKASVSSFRAQFPKWMQQQAQQYPYQVRVWDNRLATIERLLRYGERMSGRAGNQQRR